MTVAPAARVLVRETARRDFAGIVEMTEEVYPASPPWTPEQLASHLEVFPQGQLVAVEGDDERVVGMAGSLVVTWDDYEVDLTWRDFTDHGTFRNHDPSGRTLYGAEVMVRPGMQGRGIGKRLYAARRGLVEELGLLRIRAHARLRGYGRHAASMTAEEYVRRVLARSIGDPTLSFQLGQGFRVLAVVEDYLRHDPESGGHAALIEWLNPAYASPDDLARQLRRFGPPHPS